MTQPGGQQPWMRADGGKPPDRAFFTALFDDWQRLEDQREERLKAMLAGMAVRWWFSWFALSVAFGALFWALRLFLYG